MPAAEPLAARPLIDEFQKSRDTDGAGLNWTIANALAVVADDSVFEDIRALVSDKRLGKAREMLVLAFGNMKNPNAVSLLVDLLDDDEVLGHAVMALGRVGPPSMVRPRLERLASEHPQAWIRKEAKKALL